ncbi:SigB/SigF/SigG family RNA polymerase sigma factor [Gordonia sp. (in: high G+C Gram-positive bacteria)]|uniref:SigB/SigF/SigG family RNA polymerase sigma factor n=1 Tax=Gordonia sp. (in: high G+C Gram-positive bacteria) TaxID=84139 RepID=UPI00169A1533|nr:SigB/SigF/SigG family RNA polymerase sigma factor [Gordonia sp. (in: high G+C Gram-positive bacteria)]NLG47656.1 SigB/SigF/SigG family RNA polymerase sigma factor [Gordonia sp. (in: high G+C Gram-positive bacteria)]
MKDNEYGFVGDLLAERAELADDDSVRRDALRDEAIIACLPLAQHIAQRYGGRGETYDDLLQVARLGLVHAVDRFDPSLGTDFLSFAVPTVTGEVRRHFRDRTTTVRTPRRAKELALRLGDAEEQLAQRLGRSPTRDELASDLGVEVSAIDRARLVTAASVTIPLDAPARGHEGTPTVDLLGQEDAGFDLVEDTHALKPALATLRARERRILKLRFYEDLSQSAIAQRTGLSQMHVSRLLRQSITHLRCQLVPA